MEIIFAGILGLILGFLIRKLFFEKAGGRLVIDEEEDQYFVAITQKPQDLVKKRQIILKVLTKRGE